MRQLLTQSLFFFFNDTATTEIYTLSLHDALPICSRVGAAVGPAADRTAAGRRTGTDPDPGNAAAPALPDAVGTLEFRRAGRHRTDLRRRCRRQRTAVPARAGVVLHQPADRGRQARGTAECIGKG